MMNIFTVNSDIHGHNTRQLNDVHLPKVKTDIVKRSYLCKGGGGESASGIRE